MSSDSKEPKEVSKAEYNKTFHKLVRDALIPAEVQQYINELQSALTAKDKELMDKGIEWAVAGKKLCEELQAELAMVRRNHEEIYQSQDKRIAELEGALEHIIEYWNKDENSTAMSDALWHILETAEQALKDKPDEKSKGES